MINDRSEVARMLSNLLKPMVTRVTHREERTDVVERKVL